MSREATGPRGSGRNGKGGRTLKHQPHLNESDRAVSPVIGVILMVAITVILAAVIGTFVLEMGQEASQQTPKVSLSFNYDDSGAGNVTVLHNGGDTLREDNTVSLSVTHSGSANISEVTWNLSVSAGDGVTIGEEGESMEEGDTIRVVWEGNDGTKVLQAFVVPRDSNEVS